jgi:hypothetical protein
MTVDADLARARLEQAGDEFARVDLPLPDYADQRTHRPGATSSEKFSIRGGSSGL